MNTDDKNKETDFNKMGITIQVESVVIDRVLNGEITNIQMDINGENQNVILENIDGNLILVTDEMPTTFHGCYLYNDGEFPYVIKNELSFLELSAGDDKYCLARIIDVDTEAGTRFRFQGPNEPGIEDPDGDSCIWEVDFEVVPIPKEPKTYLMRWNPSISSFTEKDYEECMEQLVHGMFRMNWSIREWEEARRGDCFYMLREGDDKAGIVFYGQFLSDPYPGDDWAGSTKRRMYVDMICIDPTEPGMQPHLSISELRKAIPSVDWSKGHSGMLLPNDVAEAIKHNFEA